MPVESMSLISTTFTYPNLQIEIQFATGHDNSADHLGVVFFDSLSGNFCDINGNPYFFGNPPMPAYDPLDLSGYPIGNYTHTFTVNVASLPDTALYDVYVFAWPNGSFDDGTVGRPYYYQLSVGNDLNLACFLPGTRIATPAGERAVEDLVPGDLLLTADGRTVPIRFIGRQTVWPRFASREDRRPILITAGALGNGLPRRDLRVSANHALYLEGILVHAAALVNGTTIRREPSPHGTITYYSIETEQHELLLAEGMPCETFMDHVPREVWDNYADYKALYPHLPTIEELPYPRAISARQVPPILRRRIAAAVPAPQQSAA